MITFLKDILLASAEFLMVLPFALVIVALLAFIVNMCLTKYLGE